MLCLLADEFPPFVARFLQRSQHLRRRFREETVTDLLMGSLITAGCGRIIVEFPDEPVTGADMEWNFVNPVDGTFFRILLQAKRCYEQRNGWQSHSYKELMRKAGSGEKLQAVALCDEARNKTATYPLYIFYNPQSTCQGAAAHGFNAVAGVNLADGYSIERLVTGAGTPALRTQNKRPKTIAPLLFSLSDIFCPPTVDDADPFDESRYPFPIITVGQTEQGRHTFGPPVPPTPATIRKRIIEILNAKAGDSEELKAASADVPTVAKEIPKEIERRMRSGKDGYPSDDKLRIFRVTFVSGRSHKLDAGPASRR